MSFRKRFRQDKSWGQLSLRFLYKVVHKNGRLRKFNRAREIEINFFLARTIFMKLGTLFMAQNIASDFLIFA